MWKPSEIYKKPEPAPETKSVENREEQINFENGKRPKYRYFYHGTFVPLFKKIEGINGEGDGRSEREGKFKFTEYVPNLSLSPEYVFNKFLMSEIENAQRQAKNRGKHLATDEKKNFKPEDLTEEDSVLLVIEPTEEYKVHTTNEGMPNVFSTEDQIPDDLDKTVRTRLWTSNQKMIFKEPISKKSDDNIRHPGMHLNRKMSPTTGDWERDERGKPIKTSEPVIVPGEFPVSSVKMAIKKDPEFLKIFQDMRAELSHGNRIDLTGYKRRLIDYFKNGQGIIRDEVEDKAELAENMVVGEFEHSIVTSLRRLYLEIEKFKGKKIISMSVNGPKEDSKPAKTRDQLMERVEKLRAIEPDNDVFRKYIEIYTAALEKELNAK